MASKRDKKLRCQALLQQPSGTLISLDSDGGKFLNELLQNHPRVAEKVGRGISHFVVEFSTVGSLSRLPPSKHFVLHRVDGTSTDFSYNKCINSRVVMATPADSSSTTGRVVMATPAGSSCSSATVATTTSASSSSSSSVRAPAQPQRTLLNFYTYMALRNDISPQVQAFKTSFFRQQPLSRRVCAVSGTALTWANTDIDHAEPQTFKQLVQGWLYSEGITLAQVRLTTGDNTAGEQGSAHCSAKEHNAVKTALANNKGSH